MELILFRQDNAGDPAEITLALNDLCRELNYFEETLHGDYFVGNISVVDFTIYPLLALVKRLHERLPQLDAVRFTANAKARSKWRTTARSSTIR
jgi:glutathione S-transferase